MSRLADHVENTANLVSIIPQDLGPCYSPVNPTVLGIEAGP